MARAESSFHFAAANDATPALPPNTLLFDINVGTGAASAVITIYNGTSTSGAVIGIIDASARGTYNYGGIRCPAGLFVKLTGGNADATLTYS